MTVSELFNFIKGVRPGNAFTDEQLMVWLNEIEGKVQTDIMLLSPVGLTSYTVDADMNTELIVDYPWDKLYRYFLLMSIDLWNAEYQRYNTSYQLFNEAYEEYAGWYAQNIAPANGDAIAHGYYLTAYQFAVKGGYSGTADDFAVLLASYAGSAEEVHADRALAEAAAALAQMWATGGLAGTPSATNNAEFYAEMAKAHYGAPLTAQTAEDMTDTTRVYVYTGSETGYTNGNWYYYDGTEWQSGGVYNSTGFTTDKTLTFEDKAADAKAVRDALLYEPVAITSFYITVPSGGKAQIGSTVETVELAYTLNKTLTSSETLTLSDGGEPFSVLDDPSPVVLADLNIQTNTTYTLTAIDGGSPVHEEATATATATLSFLKRAFWGASELPASVNSDFVWDLAILGNSVLTSTRMRDITVNATSGKYIWYAVPVGFGACTFRYNNFEGGFEAAQTVTVAYPNTDSVPYNVYRSTQAGLGNTTITVS